MNEIKLSRRLEAVVKEIPAGARIADIGTDHACLPCRAVLAGIAVSAIAGEIVEGPYRAACRQVAQSGLEGRVSVRKGDGLGVVGPGEVDVLILSGLGGAAIRDILEQGKAKLDSVVRLILQPNIAAHHVRRWFLDNGWELVKENILEEAGEIYEILIGERGQPERPYKRDLPERTCKALDVSRSPSQAEILLGPFLMAEKSETFIKKWSRELKSLQKIQRRLEQANETTETIARKQDVQAKMDIIREALP